MAVAQDTDTRNRVSPLRHRRQVAANPVGNERDQAAGRSADAAGCCRVLKQSSATNVTTVREVSTMLAIIIFGIIIGFWIGGAVQYREDKNNLGDNFLKNKRKK